MADQRNIASLLLDLSFKICRCNSLLSPTSTTLTTEQLDNIRNPLSKFLYEQYRSHLKVSDRDAAVYDSYKDILRGILIYNGSLDRYPYRIQYLQIQGADVKLLPKQMFVFILDTANEGDNFTLVLNKSTKLKINQYILDLLEDINDNPLIVKPIKFPNEFIPNLINRLLTKLNYFNGQVELVYSASDKTKLLKNMTIEFQKSDLELLYRDKLYEDICDFLYMNTKIRFDRLELERFRSSLLNLSIDGKVRINNDELEEIVWYLVEAIRETYSK